MLRGWRRATVATLTAGAAIAASFMSVAPASAAAPTFTIFLTSKFAPVTNDVFVAFQAASGQGSAAVHGRMNGVTKGEVLTLYGQEFPFTAKPAPLRSITVTSTSGTQAYSFPVTPVLETHYNVRLFPSATSHALIAASPAVTLFVLPNGSATIGKSCSGTTCRATQNALTILPSVALSTEMAKHLYPYFAVNLSPTSQPPLPTVLTLNAGNPVVKVTRIHANEFRTFVTWTFSVGHNNATWNFESCTKDTVTKDGLGLPGSHGCGATKLVAGKYAG